MKIISKLLILSVIIYNCVFVKARTPCDIFFSVLGDMMGPLEVLNKENTMNCCFLPYIECDNNNENIIEININNENFENKITKPLSNTLGEITTLKELKINGKNIPGPLPEDLFTKLNSLETLNLSNNEITGKIPRTIGALSSLINLDLSNNKLEGPIVETIPSLSNLSRLILKGNELSGGIPENIDEITRLKELDIQSNQISGGIPNSIKNLNELNLLYLGDNNLSGNIPEFFGEMDSVEELNLQNNDFSGELPKSLSEMASLSKINFKGNEKLEGPIPQFSDRVSTCSIGIDETEKFCVDKNKEIKCLNVVNISDCKDRKSKGGNTTIYIIVGAIAAIIIVCLGLFVYRKIKKENEINEIIENVSIASSKAGYKEKEIFKDVIEAEESNNDNNISKSNSNDNNNNVFNGQVLNQNTSLSQFNQNIYSPAIIQSNIQSPQYSQQFPQVQQYPQAQQFPLQNQQLLIQMQQYPQMQQFPMIQQVQQFQHAQQLQQIQQAQQLSKDDSQINNYFMNSNQTPISPIAQVTPPYSVFSPTSSISAVIPTESKELNSILLESSNETNKKLTSVKNNEFSQTSIQNINTNENINNKTNPSPILLPVQPHQRQKIQEDIINNTKTIESINIPGNNSNGNNAYNKYM